MTKKLRIAINAQIPSNSGAGGIETVLRALTALGDLDGPEEYVFVGHWRDPYWLQPLLGKNQKIISAPAPTAAAPSLKERFVSRLGPVGSTAYKVKQSILPSARALSSQGEISFFDNIDCDVVHFPYQQYVSCRVPAIFNPHDLQHLHFPHFFSKEEFARRERVYRQGCEEADTVVVASTFVKEDIASCYGIPESKIQPIVWAPPEVAFNDVTDEAACALFEKYGSPLEPFALYPAMTWEHKNHLRLLDALAWVRDRQGVPVNLVCTGERTPYYSEIEKRIRELRLEAQVLFTGVVDRQELSVLYRRAKFVIIPTLFEAASSPLFEAWQHCAPAACSAVTSLPEQAAGAALLFDPLSVTDIAAALHKMSTDQKLCDDLRTKGTHRLLDFDRVEMAKAYRAVYRRAAGEDLCREDKELLSAET